MENLAEMLYSMVTSYIQIKVLENQEEDSFKPSEKNPEKMHNEDKQ